MKLSSKMLTWQALGSTPSTTTKKQKREAEKTEKKKIALLLSAG